MCSRTVLIHNKKVNDRLLPWTFVRSGTNFYISYPSVFFYFFLSIWVSHTQNLNKLSTDHSFESGEYHCSNFRNGKRKFRRMWIAHAYITSVWQRIETLRWANHVSLRARERRQAKISLPHGCCDSAEEGCSNST